LPLVYEVVNGIPTAESLRQPGVLEWAIAEFQAGRGGPLASGITETSFLTYRSILDDPSTAPAVLDRITLPTSGPRDTRLEIQKEFLGNDTEADIQINFGAVGVDPYHGDDLSRGLAHTDPGNYICMAGVLNHPLSRGSVHISSSNPTIPPVINPNYLAHPADLEILTDVVLFMQKTAETKPLTDLIRDRPGGSEEGSIPRKKLMPAFRIEQRLDRTSAIKLIKSSTISSWHPIGTCAMLPKEEGGVVDHRLRVYGVRNLRVVDASIMPLHIRGNICSSVYAIAERAADLIKEDWSRLNVTSI
jgi:choline dehydrogenase-like flavoprotein